MSAVVDKTIERFSFITSQNIRRRDNLGRDAFDASSRTPAFGTAFLGASDLDPLQD